MTLPDSTPTEPQEPQEDQRPDWILKRIEELGEGPYEPVHTRPYQVMPGQYDAWPEYFYDPEYWSQPAYQQGWDNLSPFEQEVASALPAGDDNKLVQASEWIGNTKIGGAIFGALQWVADTSEKVIGTTYQILQDPELLLDPIRFWGEDSEEFMTVESRARLSSAWDASSLFYETMSPKDWGLPGEVMRMVGAMWSTEFWKEQFGIGFEEEGQASISLKTGVADIIEGVTGYRPRSLLGIDLYTKEEYEELKDQHNTQWERLIGTPEMQEARGEEVRRWARAVWHGDALETGGLPALIAARDKILNGMNPDQVKQEYLQELGSLAVRAQIHDVVGMVVFDPMNFILPHLHPIEALHAMRQQISTMRVASEVTESVSQISKAISILGDVDDPIRAMDELADMAQTLKIDQVTDIIEEARVLAKEGKSTAEILEALKPIDDVFTRLDELKDLSKSEQIVRAVFGTPGEPSAAHKISEQFRILRTGEGVEALDESSRLGKIIQAAQDIPAVIRAPLAWIPEHLFRAVTLTPASRATEFINDVINNVRIMIGYGDDPVKWVADLKKAAAGAFGGRFGHMVLSPVGRHTQAVLKKWITRADELQAVWRTTTKYRDELHAIAKLVGGSPDSVLMTLWKGPDQAEALLTRIVDAIAAGAPVDLQTGRIVAGIQDGSYNLQSLLKIEEIFKGTAAFPVIPYDPTTFRTALMLQIVDDAHDLAVVQFGVKEASAIAKAADAVKAVESFVLLGMNYTYPIQNWFNNKLTMLSRGLYGSIGDSIASRLPEKLGDLFRADVTLEELIADPSIFNNALRAQCASVWDDFGFVPTRLEEAYTIVGEYMPAGAKVADVGQVSELVGKVDEVQKAHQLIRNVLMGKTGWTRKVANALADPKYRLFRNVARAIESGDSMRAMTIGMQKAWRGLWPRTVTQMGEFNPQLLEELTRLESKIPGLTPFIDDLMDAIYSARKPEDIDKLLFGSTEVAEQIARGLEERGAVAGEITEIIRYQLQQLNGNNVARRAMKALGLPTDTGYAAEILGDDLWHALDNRLRALPIETTTDEMVRMVFREVRETVSQHLDETARANIAQQVEEFAAMVEVEGTAAVIDIYGQVAGRVYERMAQQMRAMDTAWDDLRLIADPTLHDQAYRALRAQADASWARTWDFQEAAFAGINDGLKRAGLDVPEGYLAQFKKLRVDTEALYQLRDVEWAAYFEQAQGLEILDRHVLRAETIQRLDTAYLDWVYGRDATMKAMDDIFINLFPDASPEMVRATVEYRSSIRQMYAVDAERVIEFRKGLEGLSAEQKAQAWTTFNKERLAFNRQILQLDHAGRGMLAGDPDLMGLFLHRADQRAAHIATAGLDAVPAATEELLAVMNRAQDTFEFRRVHRLGAVGHPDEFAAGVLRISEWDGVGRPVIEISDLGAQANPEYLQSVLMEEVAHFLPYINEGTHGVILKETFDNLDMINLFQRGADWEEAMTQALIQYMRGEEIPYHIRQVFRGVLEEEVGLRRILGELVEVDLAAPHQQLGQVPLSPEIASLPPSQRIAYMAAQELEYSPQQRAMMRAVSELASTLPSDKTNRLLSILQGMGPDATFPVMRQAMVDNITDLALREAFEKILTQQLDLAAQQPGKMYTGVFDQLVGRQLYVGDGLEDLWLGQGSSLIDQMEMAAIERINVPPSALAIDSVMENSLVEYLQHVRGQMNDTRFASVKIAEGLRDSAMLNYSRQYHFDAWLGVVVPYEFWATHSVGRWLIHSVDRPAMLSTYAKMKQFLMEVQGGYRGGFPERLRGRVRINLPFLPADMGEIWVDPDRLFGMPFGSLIYGPQQISRQFTTVENRTKKRLLELLNAGDIQKAEYDQALAEQSGEAWEQAKALVMEDDPNLRVDLFDFMNLVSTPHIPISVAYNLMRGQPQEIGGFPPERLLRDAMGLMSATGLAEKLGIPPGAYDSTWANIRKALGLPGFDQWDDYRLERELVSMAAEGMITADEAHMAMIEKKGPAYVEAQRRIDQIVGIQTLGRIFGIPILNYAKGEEHMRELNKEFYRALDARDRGDPSELALFFEVNPAFEARLALWKKPDEKLRSFLVDEIWDSWHNMARVDKQVISEHFGELFQTAFLDTNTRSYNSIPIETLQVWVKIMGGETVGEVEYTEALTPIDLAPPMVAQQVETFYRSRSMQFNYGANIAPLWETYHKLDKAGKRTFWAKHPVLKAYMNWRDDFMMRNPDTIPYIVDDPDKQPKFRSEEELREAQEGQPNFTMLEWFTYLEPATFSLLYDYTARGAPVPPELRTELEFLGEMWGVDGRQIIEAFGTSYRTDREFTQAPPIEESTTSSPLSPDTPPNEGPYGDFGPASTPAVPPTGPQYSREDHPWAGGSGGASAEKGRKPYTPLFPTPETPSETAEPTPTPTPVAPIEPSRPPTPEPTPTPTPSPPGQAAVRSEIIEVAEQSIANEDDPKTLLDKIVDAIEEGLGRFADLVREKVFEYQVKHQVQQQLALEFPSFKKDVWDLLLNVDLVEGLPEHMLGETEETLKWGKAIHLEPHINIRPEEAENRFLLLHEFAHILDHRTGGTFETISESPAFADACEEVFRWGESEFRGETWEDATIILKKFPGMFGNPLVAGWWGGIDELWADVFAVSLGDLNRLPPPLRTFYDAWMTDTPATAEVTITGEEDMEWDE